MPTKSSLYFKSATLRWSRKTRSSLSAGMISQPLGDFRHLSHIGLDGHGDAFGDLSHFQRGGSLVLRGSRGDQDLRPAAPPKPPRLLSPEEAAAQARSSSSGHRKCHTLPLLDAADVEEPSLREEAKTAATDGNPPPPKTYRAAHSLLAEDDSPFCLNLDLGPSILEDVLRVMDRLHQ